MRETDQRYFDRLDARLEAAFDVATQARRQGKDPEPEVEIPVAKDMADRVENILGITGVADRVRQLEAEMGREAAALELARDFAEGRVGDYDTREGKIEGAVRTAVALLTEGVVAAPIEGIDRVEIRPNDDGTEFVRLFYAGPIRSAGGTAQALSVLVADYTRTLLGLDHYKPREDEIERYAAEVSLYDSEVGLQYSPKEDETKYIARNCPIMLDGEATSDGEVSGYRNLERVDTNRARGGMCLVLAEGIALKAPKIERYTGQLDEVDWPWVDDLIEGTFADPDEGDEDTTDVPAGAQPDDDEPLRPEPSSKYLRDLIAGRPVFGHPSEPGGFRLRYGRARNHGFATAGVHPATMRLVDDFLATGTQLKTERPGKAAGVVPVDSIEGPTVKLATGEVRRIDDPDEAKELRNGVVEILDLGEYLVNLGEFVENNHALAPASYTVEWWVQELAETGADVQALDDSPHVDLEYPTAEQAIDWASSSDAPLHPAYTYCWHDLAIEGFTALADAVEAGHFAETDGAVTVAETDEQTLVLPNEEPVRDALETLLVEHTQGDETITVPDALPLIRSLGFSNSLDREWADRSADPRDWADGDSAMDAVNAVAPFTVRERAPTRIGSRMGRPEKSEKREMNPAVHTLFPIGEAGGDQRDITAAATEGTIEVEMGRRTCPACGTETYRSGCPDCGEHTESDVRCPDCDIHVTADESGRLTCPRCGGEATSAHHRPIDLKRALQEALEAVGERDTAYEILKGVKGLTSAAKTPEPIEKGVLRAKHGVSTFKDGTVRYDMTDLPVTVVRPSEIGVSVDRLRDLGYETDLDGDPLEYDDQLVPLRVQDVLLSERAGEHLVQVADFVDDLLEEFYGLEPFYEVDDRTDLVGELVFGLAPHTSAAVIGRIAGFTGASVGYAHPYFHAAKRRNCDGDEDSVMLLMDGLLNFSKEYLPSNRGGSVSEDSQLVAVGPDDEVRFLSFEEFWNQLESPIEVDGKFRKRTCISEGWSTYAFDDEHLASLKPIEKAIRYQAATDETLLEVSTQFGRSIDITSNHSLFRYNNGIEEVAGEDLEEGDLIIAPRKLDIDSNSKTIDVSRCVDEPYVFIDEFVEGILTSTWDQNARGSPARRELKYGLSYRLRKDKISFEEFQRFLDTSGFDTVPESVKIGYAKSATGVNRMVEVNEEFAWLIGFFVAEGTLSSINPCIHNSDEDLVEKAVETTENTLGVTPSIRWSNRAYEISFPAVFREVLFELGFEERSEYNSSEKVVPECILRSPRDVALSFLRGFIEGDGSDKSDDNVTTVAFYTTSEQVKDGIVFLLHRLGLVANISYRDNRPGNRQPIYTITVSGGANDNPLHRLLEGDSSYRPKSLVVPIPDTLMELRGMDIQDVKQIIPKYLKRRDNISLEKLQEIVDELDNRDLSEQASKFLEEIRPLVEGDLSYLRVKCIEEKPYNGYLYDLQVGGDPIFTANWLYAHNSMDAPLVMSSRIDPSEIDDEAHNMDIVDRYPLEFYEATQRMADPSEVDIELAEATVGTDREYAGFDHTHDTSDIALGPSLSAYKTLGSMDEKLQAQLELARKLRAVDESDVAERIIEYHFLPDLLGNLRAFSRQETRCLDCGTKYRRPPLTGSCRECGGNVNLTVHEGSVSKYLETAITIADEYGAREYTKQRLEVIDRALESIFVNDKNKQSGIADFM